MKSGLKGTLFVSLGTVLGQGCLLVATPVITRMFTPEDLGFFSICMAMVGIFSTIAALHFELAIPLPKLEKNAVFLVLTATSVVILLASVFFVVTLAVRYIPNSNLLDHGIKENLYVVPVIYLCTGVLLSLTYYSIRQGGYRRNGMSKAIQGAGQAGAQLAFGLLGYGWISLIYGQIIGLCIGILVLFPPFYARLRLVDFDKQAPRFLFLIKKYRNFPLASVPSSLINSISVNIPVIFLAATFNSTVVGLYGLGIRVLMGPFRVLGQALSQTFYGQARRAMSQGETSNFVTRFAISVYVFSLNIFIPLAIVSPDLFGFIFGNDWYEAGIYSRLLSFWLCISFVSTPLSMLISLLQLQKSELIFQIVYLFLMTITLSVGWLVHDPMIVILLFSMVCGLFLLFKVFWLLSKANIDVRYFRTKFIKESVINFIVYTVVVGGALVISLDNHMFVLVVILVAVFKNGYDYRARSAYDF